MTRLLVIDFECFKYDWGCCLKDAMTGEEFDFWNDREGFLKFYNDNPDTLYIGYNIRHYDQYIFKAILAGIDPWKVNEHIIVKDEPGWSYSKAFRKIPLKFFDVMFRKDRSLKQIEGFIGLNIKESQVDFRVDRKLTPEELEMTREYCMHDLRATWLVFHHSIDEFKSYIGLLKMFNFPMRDMCKTKAQLASKVLGANMPEFERNDEWEFPIVDTIRLDKYKYIYDWYMNPANRDEALTLVTEVAGLTTTYRWGGLHSGLEAFSKRTCILLVDVGSFYPAIMIVYNLLSRNVSTPDKFRELRDQRIEFKSTDTGKADALKIVLNSAYGAMGDQYNALYDPRNMRAVCVNGQLLLTDLVEKLGEHCKLINGNTDGLIFEIDENEKELVMGICKGWEIRTGMSLDYKFYDGIYQKDVNTYILVKDGEAVKRVGDYVKKSNPLDNDIPIVREGLVDYLVKGIRPEDTIMACNELMKFQKIVKVGKSYIYGIKNSTFGVNRSWERRSSKDIWNRDGERLNERTFRVFASTRPEDGGIHKLKSEDAANPEKIGNTPVKCFIWNDSVKGVECPSYLDRQYYIDLVYERAKAFGVGDEA